MSGKTRGPLKLRRIAALAASCLLLGCGSGGGEAARQPTPMPAGLPGVYAGEFPCSNCAAIAATLWLRADGRFFLRQAYVDAHATEPDSAYSLGRWIWDEQAAELVLRGPGPERRLVTKDDGALQLRTASPVEHLLARDASSPDFTDRLALQGESSIVERSARFTECLTGLELPIAETNGFKELRRQHRVLNSRGKAALTTVEAHLVRVTAAESTYEALVIDRVIGLKPGVGC